MNYTWKALAWKEWREQRWKLVTLTAIGIIAPIALRFWQSDPYGIIWTTTATLVVLVPAGALLLGMQAASTERSRGTIEFLQALPVRTSRPAAIKLAVAALTIAIPVCAAVGVAACWMLWHTGELTQPPRYSMLLPWGGRGWYLATVAGGVTAGVSLLLWMAAAGVNQDDEVRAGTLGLFAILACWGIVLVSVYLTQALVGPIQDWPLWHQLLCAIAPGGAVTIGANWDHIRIVDESTFPHFAYWLDRAWPFVAVTALVDGALVVRYVRRFGRIAPPRPEPAMPAISQPRDLPLAPPRRRPFTALAWKQFRESAPLAGMGGAVVLFGVVVVLTARREGDYWGQHPVAEITSALWLATGGFVAIVAGINVLMDDLRPGLHTFWRSRPISVDRWFTTKYLLGLALTLALVGVPPLLLAAWSRRPEDGAIEVGKAAWPWVVLTGLLAQTTLFSVAMAAMALVRQAIYAAILTIVICVGAYNILVAGVVDTTHIAESLIIFPLALSLASFLIARLAVRNDWGWKS
jgi:ABC-type transport system involved in multi-copper enzyme maturation permease subunit